MAFGHWSWRDAECEDSWQEVDPDRVVAVVDQSVAQVALNEDTLELTLSFDGGVVIILRAETIRENQPPEAYSVFAKDRTVTVTNAREVLDEPRGEA